MISKDSSTGSFLIRKIDFQSPFINKSLDKSVKFELKKFLSMKSGDKDEKVMEKSVTAET